MRMSDSQWPSPELPRLWITRQVSDHAGPLAESMERLTSAPLDLGSNPRYRHVLVAEQYADLTVEV